MLKKSVWALSVYGKYVARAQDVLCFSVNTPTKPSTYPNVRFLNTERGCSSKKVPIWIISLTRPWWRDLKKITRLNILPKLFYPALLISSALICSGPRQIFAGKGGATLPLSPPCSPCSAAHVIWLFWRKKNIWYRFYPIASKNRTRGYLWKGGGGACIVTFNFSLTVVIGHLIQYLKNMGCRVI